MFSRLSASFLFLCFLPFFSMKPWRDTGGTSIRLLGKAFISLLTLLFFVCFFLRFLVFIYFKLK